MKSRIGVSLILALSFLMLLAACGSGGSPTTVAVSQSGSSTTILAGGSAVTLTATVANNSATTVAWTLSPASGCGTLGSNGTTATYTPPTEASLAADCTATITATSTASSSAAGSLSFTIKAEVATTSGSESLTPTTAANEKTITLTASLSNDSSGTDSVNWSVTGTTPHVTGASASSRALTSKGITSACGNLSAATGSSSIYTPPAGLGNCTATVTACPTLNTASSACKTFTITVNAPLGVTTASLTSGTYGSSYGPVTLQASGGVSPYTWSATGLPPGVTLSTTGSLAGTPTNAASYTPSITITDSNSYSTSTNLSLTIQKAVLTVAANNASMTYGGTVPTLSASYSGFVGSDTSTALSGVPSLSTTATSSSAAGPYPITVTAGTLSAANYSFSGFTAGTLTVNKAPVTATVTASNKGYDSTTTATITGCTLSGVLAADTGNVTCSAAAGAFSDAKVGTGKTVTATGITLAGSAASNYTLGANTSATTTANITARAITVTAAAASKTYDGTTSSTATPTITSGTLVGSDTATWTEAYDNRNVGTTHTVTPSGAVSDGNGGANYSVTFVPITNGVILVRPITVTASASSKPYDGTTSSSAKPTITTGSLGTGDTASWSETYDNAAVGTGHIMTPAGSVSDGNSGANYSVTFVNSSNGAITTASVTASFVIASKTYDGTVNATVSSCSLSGVLAADTGNVTCGLSALGSASFADANAGTGKTVSVVGITLSGSASGNYTLASTTATATGTINKATPSFTSLTSPAIYAGQGPTTLSGVLTADSGAAYLVGQAVSITISGASAVPNITTGGNFSGSLATASLSAGSYTVTYSFPSTTNFNAASDSSTTLVVHPAIVVSLNPSSSPQYVAEGGSLLITPTVTNDLSGSPNVTLTLNPSSGCGSLSSSSTASGTAVTYYAPASTVCSVSLTATSATQTSQSASLTLSSYAALTLPPPNPATLGVATINSQYSGTIVVAGGVGPYTWTVTGLSNGTLGANTSNTSNTLTISGVPGTSGSTSFNVSVKDNLNNTYGPISYSITVNAAIGVSLSPSGPSYVPHSGTLQITPTVVNDAGNGGVKFTISPTSSCGSLSVSSTTAVASGTAITYTAPSSACTATVTATAVNDNTKSAALTINVYAALALSGSNLPTTGTSGSSYTGTVNVSGGVPPYTWSVTGLTSDFSTNAPSINGTSATALTINGSPTSTEVENITVKVTDSTTTWVSQGYTITINSPTPLTIGNNQISTYLGIGLPYGANFNCSGGTGPYTWSLASTSGPLPSGLSLISNGSMAVIVGTPSSSNTTGSYPIKVQVTDSASSPATVTQSQTLTLSAGPTGNNNGYLYGHYAFIFHGTVDANANSSSDGAYQTTAIASFTADGAGGITGGLIDTLDASPVSVGPGGSYCPRTPFTGSYAIGSDNRGILKIQQSGTGGNSSCAGIWLTSNLGNTKNISGGQANYFVFSAGNIETVSLTSGTCPNQTSPYGNTNCPVYIMGLMDEADDVGFWNQSGTMAPSYVTGRADLYRQSLGQFNSQANFNTNFPGNYAMGLWGEDLTTSGYNPMAAAGILTFGSASYTSTAYAGPVSASTTVDVNDNATLTTGLSMTNISSNSGGNSCLTTAGGSTYSTSGTYPTWHTTGSSSGTYTISNGRWAADCVGWSSAPTGMPTDYVGYMVDKNHSLFMSADQHYGSSSSFLLSGDMYKQQASSYSLSDLTGAIVAYLSGDTGTTILHLTCSSGSCTVDQSDQVKQQVYTTNPVTGTLPTATVSNAGIAYFGSSSPVRLYFYDMTGAIGGGTILFSTDHPQVGYSLIQGTIPTSATQMAGSYVAGGYGFSSAATQNDYNTGAITMDSNATNLSTTFDSGRQGVTAYGSVTSGMTAGAINSTSGYYNLYPSGSSSAEVRCYIISPLATGTPLAQTSNPVYGRLVCMDVNNSNGPSNGLTVLKQVE
jgi:hypothetical protein